MTNITKISLLVLLANPGIGIGQQMPASTLDSLAAVAQQAQAANNFAAAENAYKQAVRIQPDMPELWANLGLMQQESGEIPSAILSFQRANRMNPSLYVPNLFLGIDYTRTGKTGDAVFFLLKARKEHPSDPQAPLFLGRAYISLEDFSAAEDALRQALALNSKLGSAWFGLGIAYLDTVEQEARSMTGHHSDSPYAQALFAESLEKQFRYPEAAAILNKVLQATEQPPCMRSELGYSLLRDHNPSAAASEFSEERASHPECSLSILGQARLAADSGDRQKALTLLHELWLRDRGFMRAHFALFTEGLTASRAAEFYAATAEQRASLPADLFRELCTALGETAPGSGANAAVSYTTSTAPDNAAETTDLTAQQDYAAGAFGLCAEQLWQGLMKLRTDQLQLLSSCAFFTGDYERASAAAEALSARDPHSMTAQYWLIKAHEQLAYLALDRFDELEPNSARSHILLGDIYRQRLRYDAAAAEYARALAIAPGNPAALLGLAAAYLDNGNAKQAIEAARAALAHAPDDPELNLIMAEAMIDDHRFLEARPYLDKSSDVKPQMMPRWHALLGRVDAETSKTSEAIAELTKGESSDVDGSIHYQLARLYHEVGDSRKAAEALALMKVIHMRRDTQKLIAVEDPDYPPSGSGP